MRAFEAKQITDQKIVQLYYKGFLQDSKNEAKKSGGYALKYYIYDFNDLRYNEEVVNLISSKLEKDGFYTEIIQQSDGDIYFFIVEWDNVKKQDSIAFEVMEIADKKIVEQNYKNFKKDIRNISKSKRMSDYDVTYDIDELYDSGIKPRTLERIALMLCEEGYDTMIDYNIGCFKISWFYVESNNSVGTSDIHH